MFKGGCGVGSGGNEWLGRVFVGGCGVGSGGNEWLGRVFVGDCGVGSGGNERFGRALVGDCRVGSRGNEWLGRVFVGGCRVGSRGNKRFVALFATVAADFHLGGRDGRLQLADRARGLRDEPLQRRHHRVQFGRVDPRRLTHDVSRLSSSGLAAVHWPVPTF
ncbi:hypothetical protein [Nocardia asiatica]|uniref:hypothetical protein n=1 Tax=Nocardia asiatica TaxID=209252 RepID=UPI003EDF86BB